MVPDCEPSLRSVGTCGIQLGLGTALVAVGLFTDEKWLFYSYYGVGILVVPLVVRTVSGHSLAPYQRLYVSAGLALHPYSMYFMIYPKVWWWDVLAHFVSGSLLAAGLYALFRGLRGVVGDGSAATLSVHALAFGGMVAGAVAWEVYEIYAPWLTVYGTVDTVKDVLVAAVSWALLAGIHHRVLEGIPHDAARRVGSLAPLFEAPDPRFPDDGSTRAMTDGGTPESESR